MANPTNPSLNSPINGVLINDNTPSLSFLIPQDSDSNNLVFQIELDTNNPINPSSPDYRKYESRLGQGSWSYWNNSAMIELPTAGVYSEDYGKQAYFTVPSTESLKNGIWYWKVSCSDQLTCCYFDQGTFAENKFCQDI